jgi:hypothetical protein
MKHMKIEINISNELDICVNIQQDFPPIMIGFHELEDAFEFVEDVARKFASGEEPWKQTAELKKEWEDYSYARFKERNR